MEAGMPEALASMSSFLPEAEREATALVEREAGQAARPTSAAPFWDRVWNSGMRHAIEYNLRKEPCDMRGFFRIRPECFRLSAGKLGVLNYHVTL